MPATARYNGETVWAIALADELWRGLSERKDDRLVLPCCDSPAILVENTRNEYCPRFFRHASRRKRACRRKELSPQYERLIPVIKQCSEDAGWEVHPDLQEDEVFIDILLTRSRSPLKVVVQVDLSFPKDRPRVKVAREWQRLAITNDLVFAIVRWWRSTPPNGVYTCIQPLRDDDKMAENMTRLLDLVARTYKMAHKLGLLACAAPTAPDLTWPRHATWLPAGLSAPASVRVSPGEFLISLNHLEDLQIVEWEAYLREIKQLLSKKALILKVTKPPYDWRSASRSLSDVEKRNPTSRNVRASSFDNEVRAYEARRAAAVIEQEVDLFDFDEPQDWLDGISFNQFAEERNGLLNRVTSWFGIDS